MALINPSIVAALLGAAEGASSRRLQNKISRRNTPSFGRTLSQSLAAGLGEVPGAALGDVIGGAVRTSNARTLANEERAYQDAPVDVPGNPLAAPVPRRLLSTFLEDDLAGQRIASERSYQNEPLPLPGPAAKAWGAPTAPRSQFNNVLDFADSAAGEPEVPVTPDIREYLGLPETMQPNEAGPLSGPLFKPMFDEANAQAGAVGGTMPGKAMDRLIKVKGDLATAKDNERKRDEIERSNREREANTRAGQATSIRVAEIRAAEGLAGMPTERVAMGYKVTAENVRKLQDKLAAAENEAKIFGDEMRPSIDRITLELQTEKNRNEAYMREWVDRDSSLLGGAGAQTPAPKGPQTGGAILPDQILDPTRGGGVQAPTADPVDEAGWTKYLGEVPDEELEAASERYSAWKLLNR